VYFLIDYDRSSGSKEIRVFADDKLREADEARLELELRYHRLGIEREVVVLDAASEEALRKTHARYFEDIGSMAASFAQVLDARSSALPGQTNDTK
ncbi:MAG: hypothetical protein K1Y02_23895, partial [Candidatus Hydrogenedentes bacterium]|nr:hypothetical protein [Candidatus Hydrogenedentota bacterium]